MVECAECGGGPVVPDLHLVREFGDSDGLVATDIADFCSNRCAWRYVLRYHVSDLGMTGKAARRHVKELHGLDSDG